MALKTFKSYTKSSRGTVLVDKKNLWKGKPVKSLTVGSHSTVIMHNAEKRYDHIVITTSSIRAVKIGHSDTIAYGIRFVWTATTTTY